MELIFSSSVGSDTSEGAQTSQSCGYCGKIATNFCIACKGAPGPEGGQIANTRYCDKACQKADWTFHRRFCRATRLRRGLYRAGLTLQLALYLFEEHFWYLPLEKKETTNDTKYYRENRDPEGSRTLYVDNSGTLPSGEEHLPTPFLRPFPNSILPDKYEKAAVLVHLNCSEALWCMHTMIKCMLRDICSKLEEIVVDTKNDKLKVIVIDGAGKPDLKNYSHQLIRATTKNGEVYALDLTSSQYGYHKPVIPWIQYAESRVKYFRSIDEFGEEKRQALDPKFEYLYPRSFLPFRKACTACFEKSFNSWIETNCTFGAMLNLPRVAFLKSKTELLSHLEASMEEVKESLRKHVR